MTLRELLGNDFNPERHRCGVDLAFGLEMVQPAIQLPQPLAKWLAERAQPIMGMNISGLIYNDPRKAADHYGFRADYREVLLRFLRQLLEATDCNIVLVPHVLTPPGHYESDGDACNSVAGMLGERYTGRVYVLPPFSDPRQIKWIISHFDWFCGTRMHSTIAALSSGIPTAAIAYSLKTIGVFETCGQGEHVADPRVLETQEMVQHLWRSWEQRQVAEASLREHLPTVREQAAAQMDDILSACLGPATSRLPLEPIA